MKKIIFVVISCLMLMGCNIKPTKQAEHIVFKTGENSFEVIEEKYDVILNYLNKLNSIESKEIQEFDDFYSIQIDEEMIYINEDGSFVVSNRLYTPSETTLVEMYKNALGYDVFLGGYMLNEEWIKNAYENKKVFCFNVNHVKEVFIHEVHRKEKYMIKQDKIEDAIKILNEIETYPYIEYSSGIYGIPEHDFVIVYKDNRYTFSLYEVNDSRTILIQYIYNKDRDPNITIAWIDLNSSKLSDFYEELLGCRAHSDANYTIIPNENWIELEK